MYITDITINEFNNQTRSKLENFMEYWEMEAKRDQKGYSIKLSYDKWFDEFRVYNETLEYNKKYL